MKIQHCTHEIIHTVTDGVFILGDAVSSAKELVHDYSGGITLVYLDPPFCTGLDFRSGDVAAYSDRMDEKAYMSMMRELLTTTRELLSDEGSIYLHIDYRMSAKLRLLMDEIFGASNFRNEIIWAYNSGGRTKRHFPRKHDTIFFYSKTEKYYFNIEAAGKQRGSKKLNNMKRNIDENGLVYYSIVTNGKEYRYYETDMIYPTDVWTDISHLHQRDRERTSYPTQKPLALLKRIIGVSSYEGAYVCDFFSGSGTTAQAASELHRRWIAADNSPIALLSLKGRLTVGDGRSHIYYNDEVDEADVEIYVVGDQCLVTSKFREISFLSSGYIVDGIYYAQHLGSGNTVELDTENGIRTVCVGNCAGQISFYIID